MVTKALPQAARRTAPACPGCAHAGRPHSCEDFPLPEWAGEYLRLVDALAQPTITPAGRSLTIETLRLMHPRPLAAVVSRWH